MKVKELIKLLQEQDQELDVMVYDGLEEGGGMVRSVGTQDRDQPEEWEYYKADHPLSYNTNCTDKLVMIISG